MPGQRKFRVLALTIFNFQKGSFKGNFSNRACETCDNNADTTDKGAKDKSSCVCISNFYDQHALRPSCVDTSGHKNAATSASTDACVPCPACLTRNQSQTCLQATPSFWMSACSITSYECFNADACLGGAPEQQCKEGLCIMSFACSEPCSS